MKEQKNLGDAINPYLFNEVFNKKAIHTREVLNIGFPKVYSFIGSILDDLNVKNLIAIGSGCRKI
jgi:pyruvyltransferase